MASVHPGWTTLFSKENGEPIPAIATVGGIYAPDDGHVRLLLDSDGRAGLLFPAEPEWVQGPRGPRGFPWPGWHRVEVFDLAQALDQFLRLEDEQAVLRFARRYGPLWVCPAHPPVCLWRGVNDPDDAGRRHEWINVEPVDYWLSLAAFLRAMLTAAACWRAGERLHAEDWRGMGLDPPEDISGGEWPPGEQWGRWFEGFMISSMVNGTLQTLGVGLHLSEALEPELATGLGFLPAVWQQAVAVIGGGRSLAVCSNCAKPYVRRERAPKAGQYNYCPACSEARKRKSAQKRGAVTTKSNTR